jgi:hypothetical protein
MRKLLVMLVFASAVALSNASAREAGTMIPPTVLPAPVGHAQPTERNFTPNSSADEIEQRRLSAFDAQQRRLDEMLDKKLNICRC